MVQNNLDIEDVILSESKAQYEKVMNLLTTETTSDLTAVKRAFVLPMHNVSTDRLKAALKEHKISVTNDYEKADFIIPHTNFYDDYGSIDNIPQTKMMFKIHNGYYCNDHREIVKDYYRKRRKMIEKVTRKSMLIRPSGRSTDFISPSFGYGCLYNCSYCYMKRHKDKGLTVATNTGDILTAINNHAFFTPVDKPNQTRSRRRC